MIKSLQRMPKGVIPLYIIQAFSTFAFAILYSSLSLYITKQLGLSSTVSNSIVGVFLAFNYILHLLGGVLGGRFISNRSLFFISMLLQTVGIFLLALTTPSLLYIGLSLFLIGCGINVTCFNNMLTHRFSANDERREQAFFWSYASMNLGFCSGFFISGFYDYTNQYQQLFYASVVLNVITLVLTVVNWNSFEDVDTQLVHIKNKSSLYIRNALGLIITVALFPLLIMCFHSANLSNGLVVALSAVMFFVILYLGFKQQYKIDRQKMMAYLTLAVTSIIFWMIYYTGPMGVTLFIKNNVDKHVAGYELATQWLPNINSLVIIFGAPLMAMLISKLNKSGINFSVTRQFVTAFIFLALSFLCLAAGIKFADPHGFSSVNWAILHYVNQAIAELLIGPVGYAMIGRIAPKGLQGLLMGTWMMVSGVSASLSHYFSNAMVKAQTTNPLISNNDYLHVFSQLGVWALVGAIGLYFISSWIKEFVDDTKAATVEDESLQTA